MKTLITGLFTATAILFFSGCEKENRQQATAGKKPSATPHQKAPEVLLSLSASYMCGVTTPCGSSLSHINKFNMLSINNDYQVYYSSLMYTVYERTAINPSTGIETYTALGQWTCSNYTSYYANGVLDNGDRILVFANSVPATGPSTSTPLYYDPVNDAITNYPSLSAASNYALITMGNYEGQSCSGGGSGIAPEDEQSAAHKR